MAVSSNTAANFPLYIGPASGPPGSATVIEVLVVYAGGFECRHDNMGGVVMAGFDYEVSLRQIL